MSPTSYRTALSRDISSQWSLFIIAYPGVRVKSSRKIISMPGPQRRDGLPPLLILLFVVFRSTAALEAEISGALKAELAGIALDEQTVIRAVH